jgi:hypothetical protein
MNEETEAKFLKKVNYALALAIGINVLCMLVICTILAFTIYFITKSPNHGNSSSNSVNINSRTFDDNVRDVLKAEGKL